MMKMMITMMTATNFYQLINPDPFPTVMDCALDHLTKFDFYN